MTIYRADTEIYSRENGRFLTSDDYFCCVSKTLENALRESLEFVQNRLSELYNPEDGFDSFDFWLSENPVNGDICICEIDLDSGEYGIERTYDFVGNPITEC